MSETHCIEYKESWRDEYLKWISGFANASGGKIYIGINDLGEVLGVSNSSPSSVPISFKGAYYYRSGSTKQELKGNALHQFLLKRIGYTWDNLPCEGAEFIDIDHDVVAYFIAFWQTAITVFSFSFIQNWKIYRWR